VNYIFQPLPVAKLASQLPQKSDSEWPRNPHQAMSSSTTQQDELDVAAADLEKEACVMLSSTTPSSKPWAFFTRKTNSPESYRSTC